MYGDTLAMRHAYGMEGLEFDCCLWQDGVDVFLNSATYNGFLRLTYHGG
mgnify:FL=1